MVQRSVTQHVFVTLTYKREYGLVECWKRVTKDYNRFFQKFRRLHRGGCEYIRTIECHADNYPHLHAVIQFKHGILVSNGRYFDEDLFKKWKTFWECGHTDFQAPYAGSQYPVLYIVKYISKNGSLKTLWKRYYSAHPVKDTSVLPVAQNTVATSTHSSVIKNTETLNPSTFFCKQFKIKQCSWSRNFEFPVKHPQSLLVAQSLLTPST